MSAGLFLSRDDSDAPGRLTWQRQLATAIRVPEQLFARLQLPPELLPAAQQTASRFGLLVPEDYLDRMTPGDPDDPLLRQVLPLAEEERSGEGFVADAVGDQQARLAPGLLQKYAGRVLLITTGACAVHCRYCFRREYPYSEEPRSLAEWQPAIEQIRADDSISEVILSGGDPLTLTNARLTALCDQLQSIPHLERLRWHTRLPIVLPDRIDPELLALFQSGRLKTVVVVHANHPRELTGRCAEVLQQMTSSGITTLNQAVLLRGVNDRTDVLIALSERLLELGVLPYYLHQLDQVRGTGHFEVELRRGQQLIERLRAELPGYLVPKFVREQAGAVSKTPL